MVASGSALPLTSNTEASQRVVAAAREKCAQLAASLSCRPVAIVLAGSFARNEGSVLALENRLQALGDMEFMVFFPAGSDLERLQTELTERARTLRAELAGVADCELEFGAVAPEYLRKLRPQIFGFELLTHGRTVWGDEKILANAPRFPASRIPHFDAWRMINNRLLEQLEWADKIETAGRDQLVRILYQLAKCYMDMGTAVLVFAGKYESTYRARANALRRLAEASADNDMRFAHPLSGRVAECTAFKLAPSLAARPLGVRLDGDLQTLREDIRRALAEMVPVARSVWRWAAAQLSGQALETRMEDAELRNAALATQPMREILRGWLKVALMPKVRREPAFARRMASLLTRGSPRYLTYCVASELFFELPAALAGGNPQLSAEHLLPVRFAEHASEPRAWWRLRAEALLGWRLFLRNEWA